MIEIYCGGETFLKESFSPTPPFQRMKKGYLLLNYIVRSTIQSTMFAQTKMDNFLLRFFLKKRTGFGAAPHL